MANNVLTIWFALLFAMTSFLQAIALEVLAYPEISELKQQISTLQDSMESVQKQTDSIEVAFNAVNKNIYRYQKDLEANNNPLIRLRLDGALRSARDIGDRLERLNQIRRAFKQRLNVLYAEAISAIDKEIELLTAENHDSQSAKFQRKNFERIASLEAEKSAFHQLLSKKPVQVADWRLLKIEENDSPRRIRLKKSILEDQLRKLLQQIDDHDIRQKAIAKDQKLYQEMLEFYTELNQGIDDEQEFFDRNRLDELNDRLDVLGNEMKTLDEKIALLDRDVELLREKLGNFPDTFEIKD